MAAFGSGWRDDIMKELEWEAQDGEEEEEKEEEEDDMDAESVFSTPRAKLQADIFVAKADRFPFHTLDSWLCLFAPFQ
jgi:hypothetical protein